jgi:hypothetical protein
VRAARALRSRLSSYHGRATPVSAYSTAGGVEQAGVGSPALVLADAVVQLLRVAASQLHDARDPEPLELETAALRALLVRGLGRLVRILLGVAAVAARLALRLAALLGRPAARGLRLVCVRVLLAVIAHGASLSLRASR